MTDNLYSEIFTRNFGVISQEEQQILANATITVIGAGGVGGIAILNLARLGIGNFKIVDMDTFEYSNLNRQMLSSLSRIGKSKAKSAEDSIKEINPSIQTKVFVDKLTENNALEIFKDSDVIIDATDNLVSRVVIHRAAQKMGIPSVWIAVTPPFRGGVMTFSKDTEPYEVVLNHPSYGQELTIEVQNKIMEIKNKRALNSVSHGALPEWAHSFSKGNAPWAVISPVANLVGILASFEAFKILLKRLNLPPIYAPKLVAINLADLDMVKVTTPQQGFWNNEYL